MERSDEDDKIFDPSGAEGSDSGSSETDPDYPESGQESESSHIGSTMAPLPYESPSPQASTHSDDPVTSTLFVNTSFLIPACSQSSLTEEEQSAPLALTPLHPVQVAHSPPPEPTQPLRSSRRRRNPSPPEPEDEPSQCADCDQIVLSQDESIFCNGPGCNQNVCASALVYVSVLTYLFLLVSPNMPWAS